MPSKFSWLVGVLLLVAAVATGCTNLGASLPQAGTAATATAEQSAPTAVPAQSTPTALSTAPAQAPAPTAATPAPNANEAAVAAIKAVIEEANEAQQQAFADADPSAMKETATDRYFDELTRINRSLANGGVSAIDLVKIEWGEISLTDSSTAKASTYETWRTTYRDGTTEQSRDLNAYTLVLQDGAWKIRSDEHPGVAPQSAGGVPGTGSSGSNPPAPTVPAEQTDTSRNWSGYAATGGTFTAVTGTWTVPESSPEAYGASAAWVGIGGVTSRDLIQAGTMQLSDGSGTTRYSAWIEMLPAAAETIPLAVKPGDSVTVSIVQQETDQWRITLKNNTTGKDYARTVQYQSSRSSAEWVQEAPSIGRRIVTLDDFGSVEFSGATTVKDGKRLNIAEAGGEPITLTDSRGNALAAPSQLTADGSGFSVTRLESSPVPGTRSNGRAQPLVPSFR